MSYEKSRCKHTFTRHPNAEKEEFEVRETKNNLGGKGTQGHQAQAPAQSTHELAATLHAIKTGNTRTPKPSIPFNGATVCYIHLRSLCCANEKYQIPFLPLSGSQMQGSYHSRAVFFYPKTSITPKNLQLLKLLGLTH